jgi:hypothetical protein
VWGSGGAGGACIAFARRAGQNGFMSKKRNRGKRRNAGGGGTGEAPRAKKRRGLKLNGPSLVFIGLILLAAIAMAIANAIGDRPECPAGQVWSEAHGHCH